jgi:hypothetical protein
VIEISVSEIVKAQVTSVDNILKNYTQYKEWWIFPIDISVVNGFYFQFSPIPFIIIGLKEDSYRPGKKLQFKYARGPFRGIGFWELEDLGNSKTKISYTIKLEPRNNFIGLMAKTKLFNWKHSSDIKKLIREIEKKATMNSDGEP